LFIKIFQGVHVTPKLLPSAISALAFSLNVPFCIQDSNLVSSIQILAHNLEISSALEGVLLNINSINS
jgi:hypothetical protein